MFSVCESSSFRDAPRDFLAKGKVSWQAIKLLLPRSYSRPLRPMHSSRLGIRASATTDWLALGVRFRSLPQPLQQLFEAGQDVFADAETVADGIGPTMNLDNCLGCHANPASGGSSPARNPQV